MTELKIWPEGSKLLIEVDEVEERALGGMIIVPPTVRENQQRMLSVATVLLVGPDAMVRYDTPDGPGELKPGMRIVFSQYGGYNIKLQEIDGSRKKRDLRILNDSDVLAVLG